MEATPIALERTSSILHTRELVDEAEGASGHGDGTLQFHSSILPSAAGPVAVSEGGVSETTFNVGHRIGEEGGVAMEMELELDLTTPQKPARPNTGGGRGRTRASFAAARANPVPSPTKELLPAEGEPPAVEEHDLEEIMNMRDLIPVSPRVCVWEGEGG